MAPTTPVGETETAWAGLTTVCSLPSRLDTSNSPEITLTVVAPAGDTLITASLPRMPRIVDGVTMRTPSWGILPEMKRNVPTASFITDVPSPLFGS